MFSSPLPRNILIVGGGPVGLSTAKLLSQKISQSLTTPTKEPGKIFLVEARLGRSIRPGYLAFNIFDFVSAKLNLDKNLEHSEAQHIKDLERALYEVIKVSPHITIYDATLLKIDLATGVALIKTTKTGESIALPPCYIIIDCSGQNRAVINQLIQEKKDIAELSTIAINPVKHHLIAQVRMDNRDQEKLTKILQKRSHLNKPADSYEHFEAKRILALRNEFGWEHLDTPTFYSVPGNVAKNKAMFYLEAPNALLPERYEAWIKSAMQAIAGKEYPFTLMPSESKKYISKKKQRLGAFFMEPQETRFSSHKIGELLFFALGDALMENDYRLGVGVKNGIMQMVTFVESCNIVEGALIGFNLPTYEKNIAQLLTEQKSHIINVYQTRRLHLEKAKTYVKDFIIKQLLSAKNFTARAQIWAEAASLPEEDLQELKYTFALKLEKNATKTFNEIFDKKTNQINPQAFECLLKLNESLNTLIEAITLLPHQFISKKNPLIETLQEWILNVINCARDLHKNKKHDEAVKHYKLALKFLNKSKDNVDLMPIYTHLYKDIMAVYSNLITIYTAHKDISQALLYSDNALKEVKQDPVSPEEQKSELNQLIAKIMYKQITLLLTQSSNDQKTSPQSSSTMFPPAGLDLKKTLDDVNTYLARLQKYSKSLKLLKQPISLPLEGIELSQYETLQKKVKELSKETTQSASAQLGGEGLS